MTTPTPPEGYRTPTEEERLDTPKGLLYWSGAEEAWKPSKMIGEQISESAIYAVPITESEQPQPESEVKPCADTDQARAHSLTASASNSRGEESNHPADGNPSYEQRLWDEYYGQMCADNSTRNIYETADLVDDMMAERAKRMKGDK